MRRWCCVAALWMTLMRCSVTSAVTRLALIADRDPAIDRLITLAEHQLTSVSDIQLLERGQIGSVLREQELQACFAAGATGERIKLGELLQADLLVLIRAGNPAGKSMELVICETRRGRAAAVHTSITGRQS